MLDGGEVPIDADDETRQPEPHMRSADSSEVEASSSSEHELGPDVDMDNGGQDDEYVPDDD